MGFQCNFDGCGTYQRLRGLARAAAGRLYSFSHEQQVSVERQMSARLGSRRWHMLHINRRTDGLLQRTRVLQSELFCPEIQLFDITFNFVFYDRVRQAILSVTLSFFNCVSVGKCIDALHHGRLFGTLEIRAQATGTIWLLGARVGAAVGTRGSVHGVHVSNHWDRSLLAT